MKKFLSSIIILLLTFCLSNADAATVKGRVLNNRSSAPIAHVTVLLDGTTLGAATDDRGGFTILNVPVGHFNITATLTGNKPQKQSIVIDSAEQVLEITIFLKVADKSLVPGCIPDFIKYQAELATYLLAHPVAFSFEISNFLKGDTSYLSSVITTVTNNTPYDIYLLKDYDYGKQMYASKLLDVSGKPVQWPKRIQYIDTGKRLYHDLTDIIRVPKNRKVIADTVSLWNFDLEHLSAGDYNLQLVYIFPQSGARKDDLQYIFSSPILDANAIGELYCMTLQGRFESNWLPIRVK